MNIKRYLNYLLPPFALVAIMFLILALPIGMDWEFYNVENVEQIQSPFSIPGFRGMPFAYLALPHSLLDVGIGNVINLMLNISVLGAVAYKYAGKQWHIAIAITMTTPMAVQMLMSNNIDWVPLSAFLVTDWLAYPLLAMKPQALAGAAIIRFKRNPNPLALIPLIVMLVASVVIWGDWWQQLGHGLTGVAWNFAPFPYMIPVGLFLLWKAWKADDEIIAACATPFLVPYFAPYSLTGLHVLLAARYRRAAIWLWCFAWWWVLIEARRMGA